VRAEPVKLPQGDLSLTISTGIALCGPDSDSLDTVMANADALLYQAKQSGRDQVLCAGASGGRKRTGVWEGLQVQTALREGRVVAAYQPFVMHAETSWARKRWPGSLVRQCHPPGDS
jgi:predicted signal transduction protein with EAL and GGDEF domain